MFFRIKPGHQILINAMKKLRRSCGLKPAMEALPENVGRLLGSVGAPVIEGSKMGTPDREPSEYCSNLVGILLPGYFLYSSYIPTAKVPTP